MMARIVIADRTNRYDGRDIALRPLGGTETSVIQLAEALARLGHGVTALTHCDDRIVHNGVAWRPLATARTAGADLFIAVQHPDLFDHSRRARRRALWLVWPPFNVQRRFQALRMWWLRPRVVFSSEFQVRTYGRLLPRPRPLDVLPLALPDGVRGMPRLERPPPPRAVFASNPQRNLKWLIDVWSRLILPCVPGAELHIHGIRDYAHRYGEPWQETRKRLGQFIPDGYPDAALRSLKAHPPLPREDLWRAMRSARVMLYGGHRAEAFCLAVAEAQALGVPAVVRPIAVLPERVRHGETGFVEGDEAAFAARAVQLMTDDSLWRAQHEASLRHQQGWNWDDMAREWVRRVIEPRMQHPRRVLRA